MILWNSYTRNHFKIKYKYFYNKYEKNMTGCLFIEIETIEHALREIII